MYIIRYSSCERAVRTPQTQSSATRTGNARTRYAPKQFTHVGITLFFIFPVVVVQIAN